MARQVPFWKAGSNQMGYPFGWSSLQVYYNPKNVTTKPDSWHALIDPKYKGKIVVENQPTDLMAMSGLATGAKSPYNMTSAEISRAKQFLEKFKPNVLKLVSQNTEVVNALADGSAWLAIENLGTDVRVKAAGGPTIDVTTPKEGTYGWMDAEMLTKGSKNADAFMKFINTMEQAPWIAQNFLKNGRPLFNEKAYKLLVNQGHKEQADRVLLQPAREAALDDAEGTVEERAGVHRRVHRRCSRRSRTDPGRRRRGGARSALPRTCPGGRGAEHQLPGVALPRACGRAGPRGGDQELDGARPEGGRIGAHRRERDALVARERDVVEPDDRHVARHPAARAFEPADLLDRDGVVVRDDGGGLVAQLDMVEPAPRDGLRERTLAALATGLAERTAGEREPGVTEILQVRDERVERPLLVDVDDPDPLTGLGAEASEHARGRHGRRCARPRAIPRTDRRPGSHRRGARAGPRSARSRFRDRSRCSRSGGRSPRPGRAAPRPSASCA